MNFLKTVSFRFRGFAISFFRSWYGHLGALVIMLLFSALLVTFYTTELSVIRSFGSKKHVATLLLNIVLMTPLTLTIGMTVFALDRSVYWNERKTGRWFFQLILLGVVLGLVVLHTVRLIYLGLLNQDLFDMGYIKRDFVLVMVCIGMQQVYYKIRKVQIDRKNLTNSLREAELKIETLEKKYEVLERQHAVLEERLADLQLSLDRKEQACKEYKESLGFCYKLLWSLTQKVRVSHDKMTYVHVPIPHLSKVYIPKGENSKLFYARLVDAKQVLIEINSLSSLEQLYPYILMKNKNNELVNILAFKDLFCEGDQWYLDLFGTDLTKVSKEQGIRISECRAALEVGMDKAKELLQRDRNLNSDEEK